jgi:glyoxalase family protein
MRLRACKMVLAGVCMATRITICQSRSATTVAQLRAGAEPMPDFITRPGIHHVTAIARDAHVNLAFYRDVLGLHLIKKTVNFDDPGTYHLYFADEHGTPGTVLTFFPHPGSSPGRVGTGHVSQTVFAVPATSIDWWIQRFVVQGVAHETPAVRFGETVLAFQDREGMKLALVALPEASTIAGYAQGDVPAIHAIRGIRGVTLWVEESAASATVLTQALGFAAHASEGAFERYAVLENGVPAIIGGVVDLEIMGRAIPGRLSAGSIHHVAFRAASDADQMRMRAALAAHSSIQTTQQIERNYFRSLYFRDPSGLIYEIATDDPGFAIDESPDALGTKLMLPPWLENQRAQVEAALPPLELG